MQMLAEKYDFISGWTTNPTLMRKSGVTDYAAFARDVLEVANGRPVSFEVLSDDWDEMRRQALVISDWAANAYVKIPVTNTRGESAATLLRDLRADGVRLNVTAVFTRAQVDEAAEALTIAGAASEALRPVISIFAGRVADAGFDPARHVRFCTWLAVRRGDFDVLWASPRQVYDVKLAEQAGCSIITMTPDLIAKMANFGKGLEQFSLETVEMFYRDAQASGLTL
jgi:transaldolase